ncbi:MAG TPA: hypothetical protein VKR58_07060 [Aquella sp.]|nr:hypothetical protein [Aquella sp.]
MKKYKSSYLAGLLIVLMFCIDNVWAAQWDITCTKLDRVLWDSDPNHDVPNPDRQMDIRVFLDGTIHTSFGGTVDYNSIVRDALGRPTTRVNAS